jgi:hypothetical protein
MLLYPEDINTVGRITPENYTICYNRRYVEINHP